VRKDPARRDCAPSQSHAGQILKEAMANARKHQRHRPTADLSGRASGRWPSKLGTAVGARPHNFRKPCRALLHGLASWPDLADWGAVRSAAGANPAAPHRRGGGGGPWATPGQYSASPFPGEAAVVRLRAASRRHPRTFLVRARQRKRDPTAQRMPQVVRTVLVRWSARAAYNRGEAPKRRGGDAFQ